MLEEKEDFVSDVIDEEDAERVAAHQKGVNTQHQVQREMAHI